MISNDLNNGCLKTGGPLNEVLQDKYLTSYTCLTLLSVFHQRRSFFISFSYVQ